MAFDTVTGNNLPYSPSQLSNIRDPTLSLNFKLAVSQIPMQNYFYMQPIFSNANTILNYSPSLSNQLQLANQANNYQREQLERATPMSFQSYKLGFSINNDFVLNRPWYSFSNNYRCFPYITRPIYQNDIPRYLRTRKVIEAVREKPETTLTHNYDEFDDMWVYYEYKSCDSKAQIPNLSLTSTANRNNSRLKGHKVKNSLPAGNFDSRTLAIINDNEILQTQPNFSNFHEPQLCTTNSLSYQPFNSHKLSDQAVNNSNITNGNYKIIAPAKEILSLTSLGHTSTEENDLKFSTIHYPIPGSLISSRSHHKIFNKVEPHPSSTNSNINFDLCKLSKSSQMESQDTTSVPVIALSISNVCLESNTKEEEKNDNLDFPSQPLNTHLLKATEAPKSFLSPDVKSEIQPSQSTINQERSISAFQLGNLENSSDNDGSDNSLTPVSNNIFYRSITPSSLKKSTKQIINTNFSFQKTEEISNSFDKLKMISILKDLHDECRLKCSHRYITLKDVVEIKVDNNKKLLIHKSSNSECFNYSKLPRNIVTHSKNTSTAIDSNYYFPSGATLPSRKHSQQLKHHILKPLMNQSERSNNEALTPITQDQYISELSLLKTGSIQSKKPSLFNKLKSSLNQIEIFKKDINSLLNKLTIEKFETIAEKIACNCDKISTLNELETLAEIVFNKAITQPNYCDMYADLCIILRWRSKCNQMILKEAKDFAYLLTIKLETNFKTFPSISFNATKDELENLNNMDREEALTLRKRKVLGTIQLLARLIARKLVRYDIIEQEIDKILLLPNPINGKRPDEHLIECALEFYTSIGYYTHKNYADEGLIKINRWANCLKGHQDSGFYSKRINFKIQDFLDLIKNNWTRKTFKEKAKSVAQIHQDAVDDEKLGGSIFSAQKGNYDLIGHYDNQPYILYLAHQHKIYQKRMNYYTASNTATSLLENKKPSHDPTKSYLTQDFTNETLPKSFQKLDNNSRGQLSSEMKNFKSNFMSLSSGSRSGSENHSSTSSLLSSKNSSSLISYYSPSSSRSSSPSANPSKKPWNLQRSKHSYSNISHTAENSQLEEQNLSNDLHNKSSQLIYCDSKFYSIAPIGLIESECEHDTNYLNLPNLFLIYPSLNDKVYFALKTYLGDKKGRTNEFLAIWKECIDPEDIHFQFILLCKVALDFAQQSDMLAPIVKKLNIDLARAISTSMCFKNVFQIADDVLITFKDKILENIFCQHYISDICANLLFYQLPHIEFSSLPSLKSFPTYNIAINILSSIKNSMTKKSRKLDKQFFKSQKESLSNIFGKINKNKTFGKIEI